MAFNTRLAIRLFLTMSKEDAKSILGLPKGKEPSAAEIQKAYRAKAIENHPDRGGDHVKMVEVNVAKEILEGKRREDRTPVTKYNKPSTPQGPDPEEVRKKKQEIKRNSDIGFIQTEAKKASEAQQSALGYVFEIINAAWRADLKEFLVDDFADALSMIHDQASESLKTKPNKATQDALKLTQLLGSGALHMASTFNRLKKMIQNANGENAKALEELYRETEKFVLGWGLLRTASGNLQKLIVTSEDVPMEWDDLYSKSHQRILGYTEAFEKFDAKQLKPHLDQMERSLDAVLHKLEWDYKLRPGMELWDTLKVPAFFAWAEGQVKEGKDR